jgi:hypothetical protein
MQKIIILISSTFLLVNCVESVTLLGPATSTTNGKVFQSSLKSGASYQIKKKTGKTPMGHVLAYAKEKNPEKKKERCISSIEKTNSEICMIVKKQISSSKSTIKKKIFSTQANLEEKVKVVLKKDYKVKNKEDNLAKLKESTKEFVLVISSKIKEYDARWLERIEQSRTSRAY